MPFCFLYSFILGKKRDRRGRNGQRERWRVGYGGEKAREREEMERQKLGDPDWDRESNGDAGEMERQRWETDTRGRET